jgi:hypothetical protein
VEYDAAKTEPKRVDMRSSNANKRNRHEMNTSSSQGSIWIVRTSMQTYAVPTRKKEPARSEQGTASPILLVLTSSFSTDYILDTIPHHITQPTSPLLSRTPQNATNRRTVARTATIAPHFSISPPVSEPCATHNVLPLLSLYLARSTATKNSCSFPHS